MSGENDESKKAGLIEILRKRQYEDTLQGRYHESMRRKVIAILISIVSIFFVSVMALSIGAVDIPFIDTLKALGHAILPQFIEAPSKDYYSTIIINGRLPRILLTVVTGLSLAVAGMVMQGILRNPLVSPFTLGVSTAASFGAAVSIVFGTTILGAAYNASMSFGTVAFTASDFLTTVFAFIFGMASISLVILMTKRGYVSHSTIILSGVVISYLFQAGIMFTKYVSDDEALREITLWIMGGMWNATWNSVLIALPIVVVCTIFLEKIAIDINALSSGDEVAANLGVDVPKLRRNGLILSTLMTSVCIAFTGVIGFVGLMAPHICRMLISNDSRYLLPFSGCAGVLILLISDTVSRVILRPEELPVGIIMYLIGGVFFIWMVTNKNWGKRV